MSKKLILLTCFVLVLTLAGSAPAIHWDGGAGEGSPYWNLAANWDGDVVPTSANDVEAIKVGIDYGPTIANPGAEANNVYVGTWTWPGELTVTLSGSLTAAIDLVIANDANNTGVVVNEGSIDVGTTMYVGLLGDGLLNMNCGTIVIDANLSLGVDANATGHANFHGGTVTAGGLLVQGDGTGTADFTTGVLIADGNHTIGINWMATAPDTGWWTAYGGWDAVECDYNNINPGATTVWATDVNYSSLGSALIRWDCSGLNNRWDFAANWEVTDFGYPNPAIPRSVDLVQLPDTDIYCNPIPESDRPVIYKGIVADANQLYVGEGGLGDYTSYLTVTGGTLNVTVDIYIGVGATDGQIDISGGTINTNHMVVGAATQNGYGTLNMTGGSINVTGPLMYIGGGPGTNGVFNISGGTVFVDEALNIGAYGGDGTLNMTGGAIDCNVMRVYLDGTAGHAQLDGGSITANDFVIDPNHGTVDITGGMLILSGDKREVVRIYDTGGQLTAYSGSGSLLVWYNPSADNTSVAATSCPEGDINWDCKVDFFDFARMADNWLVDNNP